VIARLAATAKLPVMDTSRPWLRLHLASGIGGGTVARMLKALGDGALVAPEAEFARHKLRHVYEALHSDTLDAAVEALLESLAPWPDVRLVTPADEEYPRRLREFHSVPPVLFVRGVLLSNHPSVAVVGSRKPGSDREELTMDWCKIWAQAGVSIVSGLAEGIDGAAHRGALAGGGYTVAVLGTGPERTYPSPHASLQDGILASGGAVVSQFAPLAQVFPSNFPARNTTLAGLSDSVVIVKAGAESGALYTAEAASKSGRPVLVAPSDLADLGNAGGLNLLRGKARAIGSPDDLLELLKLRSRAKAAVVPLQLSAELEPVHAALEFSGSSLDELMRKLQLPAAVVLDRLLELELAGAVVRQPGPRYVRIR
jgi:DNA processing protein